MEVSSYAILKSHNDPFILVTVTIKARRVTVKGPKGEIVKDFRHMAVELSIK
jgi:ribosomal protein L6P/L9E